VNAGSLIDWILKRVRVSMFAPFNRHRISKLYGYEAGELRETVTLFKQSRNGKTPFVKIEESATKMAATRFSSSPTQR